MLAAAVAVAISVWGPAPCAVEYRVAELGGQVAATAAVYPDGRCVVTFDDRPWPYDLACSVLVHEWGHLVGWRDPVTGDIHSSDPTHVMFPVLTRVFRGCVWPPRGTMTAGSRSPAAQLTRPEMLRAANSRRGTWFLPKRQWRSARWRRLVTSNGGRHPPVL